ncbi:hypothetical protein Tco_0480332 [Tanacetum coccineum]
MKKIIKEHVKKEVSKIIPKVEKFVNDRLKSEVLVRSSKSYSSHAVAANLSDLELKKILIDKMETNNSINRSDIQRQLYTDLVEAYAADKILLDNLADTGRKLCNYRRSLKDQSQSSKQVGNQDDKKREVNMFLIVSNNHRLSFSCDQHGIRCYLPFIETVQPLVKQPGQQEPRESFWSNFELLKGTCKSLTELEYFCEEVYKATTEKLDWINPEGRQYPHDLRQPLPLIPNSQGRRVIPFNHFINNDLEFLSGGVSSRKYSTSVTKTQAADYGHIKWIEDLVPNSMWSQTIVKYDKFALWGVSHWGKKRRQFYAFAALRESARDVYSKRRIIACHKVEYCRMA